MDNLTEFMEEMNMTSPMTLSTTTVHVNPITSKPTANPAMIFWYTSMQVIFFVGTLANTLSVVVFTRKNMRGSLTSFLFTFLAICDLSNCLLLIDYYLFYAGKSLQVIGFSKFWPCRITYALMSIPYAMSKWALALITIERVIGVYIPHKAKIYCTVKRAVPIIAFLILCQVLLNLPVLMWYRRYNFYSTYYDVVYYICWYRYPKSALQKKLMTNILPMIDMSFNNLTTGGIMLLGSILIIIRLFYLSKKRLAMSGGDKSSKMGSVSSSTMMLLSNAVMFIILISPNTAYYYKHVYNQWEEAVQNVCLFLNYSINFFLYILTGRKFRNEFLSMFGCGPNTTPRRFKASVMGFSTADTSGTGNST